MSKRIPAARHDVAGQWAQESGDHASAAWARRQQILRTQAKLRGEVRKLVEGRRQ